MSARFGALSDHEVDAFLGAIASFDRCFDLPAHYPIVGMRCCDVVNIGSSEGQLDDLGIVGRNRMQTGLRNAMMSVSPVGLIGRSSESLHLFASCSGDAVGIVIMPRTPTLQTAIVYAIRERPPLRRVATRSAPLCPADWLSPSRRALTLLCQGGMGRRYLKSGIDYSRVGFKSSEREPEGVEMLYMFKLLACERAREGQALNVPDRASFSIDEVASIDG